MGRPLAPSQTVEYRRRYHREWYQRNRAKKDAKNKEWLDNNKERRGDYIRKFRSEYGPKQRAAQRSRYHENSLIVDAIKSAPCMDCGGAFPPCAMDFDHVRGKKKKTVAALLSWPLDVVLDEIEKCDLVCSNCHRIRTYERRIQSGLYAKPEKLGRKSA